jgi:UDPglucose 6-dehydrogenase
LRSWDVDWAQDLYEGIKGKNGLLILTEWQDFKNADLQRVKEALAHPLIIDYRNLFNDSTVEDLGLTYERLGRKKES